MPQRIVYVKTHGEDIFRVPVDQWGLTEAKNLISIMRDEQQQYVLIGAEMFHKNSIKRVGTSIPQK